MKYLNALNRKVGSVSIRKLTEKGNIGLQEMNVLEYVIKEQMQVFGKHKGNLSFCQYKSYMSELRKTIPTALNELFISQNFSTYDQLSSDLLPDSNFKENYVIYSDFLISKIYGLPYKLINDLDTDSKGVTSFKKLNFILNNSIKPEEYLSHFWEYIDNDIVNGYFGRTMPVISELLCHFKSCVILVKFY
ncbi:MAG: hypothetical protein WBA74_00825 [Cyclobacteriaceae bacterium]